MRIPYTHNLSLMLEEMSRRDDGPVSKCLQVMLYQTLADKLWSPFKAACFNPFITLAVVLVLYLVFFIIYTPLWLTSFLVTTYGSWAIFLILVNWLANIISRKIAFAGSNISVKKQISAEFFKRIAMHLESVAILISDFTAILLLGASGQIPFQEIPPMDVKLKEIHEKSAGLPLLATFFRQSIGYLSGEMLTTPQETLQLEQLCTAVEEQVSALKAMQPLAVSYITSLETFRRNTMRSNRANTPLQAPKGTAELFKVASHCIKMSKALKVAVDNSKPPPAPEDDGGILSKVKGFLSFTEGLQGCEKITFPYMRCMLIHRFKAEPFTLTGCDKNTIDGVILPAATVLPSAAGGAGAGAGTGAGSAGNSQSSAAAGAAGTQEGAPQSPVGLVLFCSPNAAFFEVLCQCDLSASWLGYYTQLGYDVCMFNYRGYGQSSGTPNPHSVKADACQVYEYLQRTRRPYRIIVHGESIGGMVACHLARTFPVDALVCDRTFATLDATAARLMGRWAGWGLKYCTLWSTNVVRDYLACTCPKIIIQDPDDEIICNLASLKNGIAMRLVMGDLSWKVQAEPAEYTYAAYLKAELPHKEDEAAMIEEASDANRRLSERFVAHFHACVADLARRSAALTGRRARRRQGAALTAGAVTTAATPRRPSRVVQSELDKATTNSNAGANSTELSRRVAASANSAAANTAKEGAGEDGYTSSHSSRHDSRDFSFGDDDTSEGNANGYESDGSARGLILDMIGLRAASADGWGPESSSEGVTPDDTVFRDVEEGHTSSRRDGSEGGTDHHQQGHGSSHRVVTSRREMLEQFCATPMRDVVSGAGGAGAKSLGPSAITKAWAAVGRIDGGSGQLLGQALSGGMEGIRAWLCSYLVWSTHAAKDAALPAGCTDMAGSLADLRLLSEELHVAELEHDRAVVFLKQALEALIRRRETLVFHKPPLGVMLRGAMAYLPLLSDQTEGTAADDNGNNGSGSAAASRSPAEQMMQRGMVLAARCAVQAKKYLTSNPYASIDALGDVDNLRCGALRLPSSGGESLGGGGGGSDGGEVGAGRSACILRADALTSGELFAAANVPSPRHMPYIGSVIAVHCGHNGWPTPTELASLTEFFAQVSLA